MHRLDLGLQLLLGQDRRVVLGLRRQGRIALAQGEAAPEVWKDGKEGLGCSVEGLGHREYGKMGKRV